MRKEDRNKRIMEDVRIMIQSDVARKYGISRQRVKQIVDLYGGLPSVSPKFKPKLKNILT